MRRSHRRRRPSLHAGTIVAAIVCLISLAVLLWFFTDPIVTDTKLRKEAGSAGMDLLKLHEMYPDLAGWIKVEGTNIDYPVMIGEAYLCRSMNGDYDAAGTPFVADDWSPDDRCTVVCAHNMWMYGTMFHELCNFKQENFLRGKMITFYTIYDEDVPRVEKRLYSAAHCILTDVCEWNYSAAQYIESDAELRAFVAECDERSLRGSAPADAGARVLPEKMILLSTCSYHIRGKNGRIVVSGMLIASEDDNILSLK